MSSDIGEPAGQSERGEGQVGESRFWDKRVGDWMVRLSVSGGSRDYTISTMY
jgi:hypothetical protein